jgi:hypothetical protein
LALTRAQGADFGIAKRLNDDNKLTRPGLLLERRHTWRRTGERNSRHVGQRPTSIPLGQFSTKCSPDVRLFSPEDSEAAITVRVLTEDPVSPAWHQPDIPRDLETICMKCLEKEPRNRYASAAAFAEDLRRFLDDESIQAKPPSTVGSSIKWLRRHPWKSVGIAAGVVLVIAATVGLVRWELYSRPHLEYASQVDWINGRLEPLAKISLDAASHSAAYLRLTRRGRLGPISKVEILNARGYPAVLRRLLHREMIPIYVEGLAGAQPYTEKTSGNYSRRVFLSTVTTCWRPPLATGTRTLTGALSTTTMPTLAPPNRCVHVWLTCMALTPPGMERRIW